MTDDLTLIKQKLWLGSVNITINWSKDNKNYQFLLCGNRNIPIGVYYSELATYFGVETTPIWLQHEGVPIKWNLPVGFLYDYYYLGGQMNPEESNSTTNRDNWHLELITGDNEYPQDIIPFLYHDETIVDYNKSVNEAVFHQLKQSCFVMSGNSKAMLNLSKDESHELWLAIAANDSESYFRISKKLIPSTINRIPIKVYVSGTSVVIQAPVYSGEKLTLAEFLQKYAPLNMNECRVIIHGIDTKDLGDVPIEELWMIFKHLDNFLYISIIGKGN